MKILVIGSGGREHAIVWKLAQSSRVSKIFCAPGNAGIAQIAECANIKANDIEGLLLFARDQKIDLTVVGPEEPLCLGIADRFQSADLKIFGPAKKPALLEGSKAFAKNVLWELGIPTAPYRIFSNPDAAKEYLSKRDFPVVIKADGLAGGKGVKICSTRCEALEAVNDVMILGKFGEAGKRIVIEDCLEGEEASYIVIVDSRGNFLPLASSQDHKREKDGDEGRNTGGMGAYSPAPVIGEEMEQKIINRVIRPLIAELRRKEILCMGFLYTGLMVADDDPYVLEFNVRLGDPETQPILMRMESDFAELILAALEGDLNEHKIAWHDDSAVSVVLAAEGYPESPRKGDVISGIDEAEKTGAIVFHAGTAIKDGKLVTNGGRVLGVTALGKDVKTAKDNAYKAVEKINFSGMHYRTDIADRAIKR